MITSKFRFLLDFLHKSKIVEVFLGKTKPSTTMYSNVHEERRQVLTTKSPTRLTYAGSLLPKSFVLLLALACSTTSFGAELDISDIEKALSSDLKGEQNTTVVDSELSTSKSERENPQKVKKSQILQYIPNNKTKLPQIRQVRTIPLNKLNLYHKQIRVN